MSVQSSRLAASGCGWAATGRPRGEKKPPGPGWSTVGGALHSPGYSRVGMQVLEGQLGPVQAAIIGKSHGWPGLPGSPCPRSPPQAGTAQRRAGSSGPPARWHGLPARAELRGFPAPAAAARPHSAINAPRREPRGLRARPSPAARHGPSQKAPPAPGGAAMRGGSAHANAAADPEPAPRRRLGPTPRQAPPAPRRRVGAPLPLAAPGSTCRRPPPSLPAASACSSPSGPGPAATAGPALSAPGSLARAALAGCTRTGPASPLGGASPLANDWPGPEARDR